MPVVPPSAQLPTFPAAGLGSELRWPQSRARVLRLRAIPPSRQVLRERTTLSFGPLPSIHIDFLGMPPPLLGENSLQIPDFSSTSKFPPIYTYLPVCPAVRACSFVPSPTHPTSTPHPLSWTPSVIPLPLELGPLPLCFHHPYLLQPCTHHSHIFCGLVHISISPIGL